ncbi:hypothetical protein [Kamptonema sp. UHCC 0994]|uniref:hypothetical protein n=1 Tax=Kamptonema sp. UHCC 0994 TaxID=3031329 RepID=UPI0023BA8267|nr:hypothetical protein [Kamptonema sp. UHCC 0994]MDF0556576.1 hypothetical protein [Kamptonema sp. UHCC 0994]
MTELVKATRTPVVLGYLEIDGFMLPDGSYRMSLTQAGECVGKTAQGVSNFLSSKTLKRLLGEAGGVSNFLPEGAVEALSDDGYTADIFLVDIGESGGQGQTRIRGLPLEIVSLYWQWESFRGNKQAFILSTALVIESLERRFDAAFEITRSEPERNVILIERIQQLERDISEAFWIEDEVRIERDHYERLLRENGIDPWGIPGGGDESG